MRRRPASRRAGFTLLETVIAAALLVLVLGNIYSVLSGSSTAIAERNKNFDADAQTQRALDRIGFAIIGACSESLLPTSPSPGSVDEVGYMEFLGMSAADADGDGRNDPVYSDPMKIGASAPQSGDVSWFQNPGTELEKHVVWVKDVPEVAIGEIAGNGVDDNENGLVDETGLSFVKNGRSVRILLSLRIPDGAGGFIERTRQTTVTCRN